MSSRKLASGIAACFSLAGVTAVVQAQLLYDTIGSGNDGVAFFNDTVIDDLTIEGDGLLQTITVLLTAQGAGATEISDVSLLIARDGGDGLPDIDGSGDDSFMIQTMIPGVEVPVGGVLPFQIDVSNLFAHPEPDSLLFAGLQFSNPNVGHVFAGAPSPGSTDQIVFSFANFGPIPAPGITTPSLTNSLGLSFTLDAISLPGPRRGGIIDGTLIDFEEFSEGGAGPTVVSQGTTFADPFSGFGPPGFDVFAIDDGTAIWDLNPAMTDYVDGNLLNINAFSSTGYVFSALKSVRITPPAPASAVRVSVAYVTQALDADFRPSIVRLLALRNGQTVATDAINADNELGTSGGGTFSFGAGTLEITGVEFDELVLYNNGPGPFGTVQMGLDNVLIGNLAPCQADWNGDGIVATNDFVAFLNDYNAAQAGLVPQYGTPDIAEPYGVLNTADFAAFLNVFAGGC